MMNRLTLRELVLASGGRALFEPSDEPVAGVAIDSRKVTQGGVFICIKGERLDGHNYIDSAFRNGAAAVVSEKKAEKAILVDSTLAAYQRIAGYYFSKFDIPKIGLTGSVGKTTTKELIYCVLSQKYDTLKNEGNLNSQTGVPATLLRLERRHQAAVVEMGMSMFGEMDRLSAMVKPTIAVFTNIGESHIEFLGSKEGIFNAKTEMLAHLTDDAPVIINGNDPILSRLKSMRKNVISCGFGSECDCYAEEIEKHGFDGVSFTAVFRGERTRIFLPAPGGYMITNALIALAAGMEAGVSSKQAVKGLASFVPSEGRMHIIDTGKLTLLSDAYNANPTSMRASIDTALSRSGRRVLILGDMYELGQDTEKYHHSIGEYAAEKGADLVISVGELAEAICSGARDKGASSVHFSNKEELQKALPSLLKEGDTVLVKASHGMHLDETAEFINAMS